MPAETNAAAARAPDIAGRKRHVHDRAVGAVVVVAPDQPLLVREHRASSGAALLGHGDPFGGCGSEHIIGTKRLYADGKFNTKDGKAVFMETQWRGLQASGKQQESEKFPFLINNGRANHVWQSAYLDQQNDLVMDRYPWPFIEMNPADVAAMKLKAGDLVEVYNDNGSTQAMVYPTDRVKPKASFMLFGFPVAFRATSYPRA